MALRWTPAVLWMAFIFGMSSVPATGLPGGYSGIAHFTEYAILATLVLFALQRVESVSRTMLLTVFICAAYAVTDEFHQSFVPGRVPDPVDWLVDTAGAASIGLIWLATKKRAARKRPS